MRIKTLFFLFVVFLAINNLFSTSLKKHLLNIKIENAENLNSYQKDFVYLTKVLEDSHPAVFQNFPREKFKAEKERLLKEFASIVDKKVFLIKIQQFVAKIGDAHTNIDLQSLFNSETSYPVKFRWIKNDLFVIDVDKSLPDSMIGTQVVKFEDVPLPEVIKTCGSIISAENDIWLRARLKRFLTNPLFLSIMKVTNTANSLRLTTIMNGKEMEFVLRPQKKIKWRNTLKKNRLTGKKHKVHSYKILKGKKVCYYQFNKFYDRKTANEAIKRYYKWYIRPFMSSVVYFYLPNYEKFLSKMFADMKKNGIEKIIVDLRYNGGGNSALGDLFMYHCKIPRNIKGYSGGGIKLSELFKDTYSDSYAYFKKDYMGKHKDTEFKIPLLIQFDEEDEDKEYDNFKRFEEGKSVWKIKPIKNEFAGKIILLIGQNTFSSASMFSTILSDNNQATLIGEPIGQKPTSFGDLLSFQLPETEVNVTVSHKIFQRPDKSKNDDPTLFPDIEIYPTIEDIINGNDPVFEKALDY